MHAYRAVAVGSVQLCLEVFYLFVLLFQVGLHVSLPLHSGPQLGLHHILLVSQLRIHLHEALQLLLELDTHTHTQTHERLQVDLLNRFKVPSYMNIVQPKTNKPGLNLGEKRGRKETTQCRHKCSIHFKGEKKCRKPFEQTEKLVQLTMSCFFQSFTQVN